MSFSTTRTFASPAPGLPPAYAALTAGHSVTTRSFYGANGYGGVVADSVRTLPPALSAPVFCASLPPPPLPLATSTALVQTLPGECVPCETAVAPAPLLLSAPPLCAPAPAEAKRLDIHLMEQRLPHSHALFEELKKLREELFGARVTEETLEQELAEARGKLARLADLEAQVLPLRAEIASLKDLVFRAERRAASAEAELEAAQQLIKKLEGRVKEAEERANQAQAVHARIRSLEQQLADAQERAAALQRERDAALTEVGRLSALLTDANHTISRLQGDLEAERGQFQRDLAALRQRLAAAIAERDAARTETQHYQDQLLQAKAAADRRINELQLQFDEERARLQRDRDDARANARALELKLQEANHALSAAEQRNAQLQSSFDIERRRLTEQIAGLQSRVAGLEQELEAARSGLRASEAKVRELSDALQRTQQQLQQTQLAFEAERARMQDQIVALQARVHSLEGDLNGALNELRRLEAKLQETTEQLAAANQRLKDAEARFAQERSALQNDVFNLQKALAQLEAERDEARREAAMWQSRAQELDAHLDGAKQHIANLEGRLRDLEQEVRTLRTQLKATVQVHSQTSVKETYKVKTFEMAAKLAVMDGTDDGMYNGLPIEVEGEGLYRDLVAQGRRPQADRERRPSISKRETYKVTSFEMADRLAKSDGSGLGIYQGLPIEVTGEGLYLDLVRAGRRSAEPSSPTIVSTTSAAAAGQTYVVNSVDAAATLSRMGPNDDGTYKGMLIEVKGQGLYRNLRAR
eukprot:EG_transcript_3145